MKLPASRIRRFALSLAVFICPLFSPAAARNIENEHSRIIDKENFIKSVETFATGSEYRCSTLAHTVNFLRRQEKDSVIRFLNNVNAETMGMYNTELIVLCRCLFDNPGGWGYAHFGEAVPAIKDDALEYFPSYPIVYADDVLFLLVIGYRMMGRGESLYACLEKCKGLSLRNTDIPLEGYDKAATKLIRHLEEMNVYEDKKVLAEMEYMILDQAKMSGKKGVGR